jgi:ABC-type enterochelin transport system permease subunit
MILVIRTHIRTLVSIIVAIIVAIIDPTDTTLVRNRLGLSLDMIKALLVILLAVVLTVGYQVLRLWARRADSGD